MAAATVNSTLVNVNGSFREEYFNLDIATTGDTFQPKAFTKITGLSWNDPGAVTKASVTLGNLITFTTTGAITGLLLTVTGE